MGLRTEGRAKAACDEDLEGIRLRLGYVSRQISYQCLIDARRHA
jgi:hypothetical protein